jgi:carbonic anhydrase/acetyltransferase-like protein (isoleucine patch superfamily)
LKRAPVVHPDTWVSDSAQLYGAIHVAEDCSIWHNAVLRAECAEIRIGRMSNLQDFVMVHVGFDHPTQVGAFCSITHHVTLHGCTIGDHCLVGINATIMDGAEIGAGSIVAGGAFVTEGKVFPSHSIVAGVPAKVIGERDSARENRMNAWQYHRNAAFTRRGDHDAWVGPEYEAWRRQKRAEIERDADL